ncbi:MAG: OmpA family protein [Pseudomonadota bacterium]
MTRKVMPLLAATSILALSACGDRTVFESWNQEAGAFLDRGSFGASTLNNREFHSGERTYAVSLNKRFREEVQSVVNFPFNSAILDGDARAILDVQANWIRQFPEVRFKVYGHTDLVGSQAANKRLGQRRANTVVNYLVERGVDRKRLQAVVSFGETRPLIYTELEERQNRRAVTEVSGFVQNNRLVLDGQYAQIIFREYVDSATELPPNPESGLAAIEGAGG